MTISLRRTAILPALALAGATVLGPAAFGPVAFGPAAAHADNNKGMPTVKLKVVNKTGHKGNLYVYVWGTDVSGGTQYYVKNRKGDVAAFADSATFQGKGVKLGKKKKATMQVPQLISGRVYFSLDKKMQVTAGGGAPSTPDGWTRPTSTGPNPNFNTIFDWFEFTYQPASAPPGVSSLFNGNLTQVDMVGIPMLLRLNGVDANLNPQFTKAGFSSKTARRDLIKSMKKAPKPWNKLVVKPNAKIPSRVVSPYNGMSINGIGLGKFPNTFLDSYIGDVFAKYARTHLIAQTTGPTASFTGVVNGNQLVFTNGANGETVTFAKPTSYMVYYGYYGTLSDPGDQNLVTEGTELARYLQAAFLRSVIMNNANISHCTSNPAGVYYKTQPIDYYSRNVHAVATDHKAYGFGWDDVCDQASDYTVFDPKFVQVKLLPLN